MRMQDVSFTSGMADPKTLVECSAMKCVNHFHLADGWAFPGRGPDGELRLFLG